MRFERARKGAPRPELADDLVLLEVDQILVEPVVGIQCRELDFPVFRRLCQRFQGLLDVAVASGAVKDVKFLRLISQDVVVAIRKKAPEIRKAYKPSVEVGSKSGSQSRD